MSITFNGTDSKIELSADLVGGSVNEAIFCWVRPRGISLSGNSVPMGLARDSGSPNELSIITIGGASVRAQAGDGTFSANASVSSSLSDTWIPMMAVFTSTGNRTIYVGGSSASNTDSIDSLAGGAFNRLRFGHRPWEATLWFAGDIAEPAIWSGTLPDATDFASLAGGALPETIKSGSLIWHRQFLVHTDLAAGAAGSDPTGSGTLATGATHPITRSGAPVLSSPSGTVTSNTAATITHNTDTVSDGTTHYLRRTGGSAASAATIISTGESQSTGGSTGQSKSVTLLGGTANQYVDIAQDGTAGDSNVITVGPLTTATTLSAPTGTATGNTTATVGFTTDRAVSAAFPAYFLTLPAADSPPADAAALIANGATVNQTTTPTRALTGLTTATAYRTHMCQPGSNVVSSASYTPSTLTYSGTIGPQGGVQGSAHVWSGAAPSTLVSGGIGTKSWSGTGLGASGLTVNATSGQLQGTYGTPGTYNITLTCTDQSTAGTNPTGGGSPPQTVVSNTFTLTITATGSPPTVATNPNNLTVTDGATASFTASFNGSPIPSLQWQEFIGGVWTAMSGETGNVLALGTVTLTDSGRSFRLGGTNTAGGPVYTASATLTVTPAVVGTITSDIFAGWGGATPIASTTIQFVTIERVSTGAITLQLTNQVTGTDGRLIVTNAAITPGVEYMLWCRNTAGTIRGGKKYTAT